MPRTKVDAMTPPSSFSASKDTGLRSTHTSEPKLNMLKLNGRSYYVANNANLIALN